MSEKIYTIEELKAIIYNDIKEEGVVVYEKYKKVY